MYTSELFTTPRPVQPHLNPQMMYAIGLSEKIIAPSREIATTDTNVSIKPPVIELRPDPVDVSPPPPSPTAPSTDPLPPSPPSQPPITPSLGGAGAAPSREEEKPVLAAKKISWLPIALMAIGTGVLILKPFKKK